MSKQTVPEFGTGVVMFYLRTDEDWESAVYIENAALDQIGERWFVIGRIPRSAVASGEPPGRFSIAWDTVDAFTVLDENPLGGELFDN